MVQLAVGFCPSLPVGTSDGNHCQSDNKTCQIRSAKFWPFIKEQTHIFSQQQLKILFLLQGRKMDLLLALNWRDSKSKVTCRCTSNINKPFTSADAACPYTLALDCSTSSFEILPLPASPLSLFPCNLSMLERVNIMLKLTKNYSPKGGKMFQSEHGLKNESCLMYFKIYGLFLQCKTLLQLTVLIRWKFRISFSWSLSVMLSDWVP